MRIARWSACGVSSDYCVGPIPAESTVFFMFFVLVFENLEHRLCTGLTFYDSRDDRQDTAQRSRCTRNFIDNFIVEASSEHSTRYKRTYYKGTPPRLEGKTIILLRNIYKIGLCAGTTHYRLEY